MTDHTVLSVVVGSRAYGLSTAESDTDRRGVFVAPASLFWRLDKPPTHVEGPLPEQFSWEVERLCALALALFGRSGELKPLLYAFRVLLTGLRLMRTGEVVADVTRLYEGAPPYLPELVAAKREAEHGAPPAGAPDAVRLTAELAEAEERSALPEAATAGPALHDLLVRVRTGA
ncbi:DNA polymerase beta superfamily protein [Spongiactinospora gelatinilytica]|uniref:DNA polymerase beta superfamily protein n=1 Tax=Spongiactinospora gelatinilytica TaxID=2666298 RepID=UPI001F2BC306|nr:nucleotidyltransferase domain-containing protein [Spongiactinospora gelatinilytica]